MVNIIEQVERGKKFKRCLTIEWEGGGQSRIVGRRCFLMWSTGEWIPIKNTEDHYRICLDTLRRNGYSVK